MYLCSSHHQLVLCLVVLAYHFLPVHVCWKFIHNIYLHWSYRLIKSLQVLPVSIFFGDSTSEPKTILFSCSKFFKVNYCYLGNVYLCKKVQVFTGKNLQVVTKRVKSVTCNLQQDVTSILV